MKRQLLDITKQTDNRWLNIYVAHYQMEKSTVNYEFASRRRESEIAIREKTRVADAVRILPYFIINEEIFVVFIKEFRSPLNRYIYGFPAGLIERGENPDIAAKRETSEETGGTVLKLTRTDDGGYSSAGLTDECIMCYTAEVEMTGLQNLEDTEDIEVEIVSLKDMPNFLSSNQFCLQSRLQAWGFYYKQLYEKSIQLK